MIFVTVGTQKFQMDRLLKAVDEIACKEILQEKFFVQRGYGTYIPEHCDYVSFLNKGEMEQKVDQCTVLVCHAGVGSILLGLERQRKVIVVPRMERFGEHVDDHQIEIAESFAKAGYIKLVKNESLLADAINECVEWIPKKFVSNKEKFNQLILNSIRE